MELEDRLSAVEAELAIQRLIADYSHGFDKRDPDRFASVWHDGGEWLPAPGITCVGQEQILQTARAFWDQLPETHHWSSNLAIEVEGDTAEGLVDVSVSLRDIGGGWFRASATYRDQYARRDGRWGFVRREAEMHHQEPLATP